ncbi:unnamed protein product [Microthlaspi erraticum]|uniref:Uncharacterized protein n=1 Tax=Microthlaspi erraticum TaxID=1685480 RepID=A0A6D2IV26_9BRAS|nr:unnamed protein product [Microthlaspi erraticum]
MNAYAKACEKDADLKSFDESLHEGTNEVISVLGAVTDENQFLSLDKLLVAWNFLLKMNENVFEKEYDKAAKRQIGLVLSLESSMQVNIKAMETIRIQVDSLRIVLDSIHLNVDFVLDREEEEEATRLAMQEIKKVVDEFSVKIKEVGENTARCSQCIATGRVIVLQYIIIQTK